MIGKSLGTEPFFKQLLHCPAATGHALVFGMFFGVSGVAAFAQKSRFLLQLFLRFSKSVFVIRSHHGFLSLVNRGIALRSPITKGLGPLPSANGMVLNIFLNSITPVCEINAR
jgi:hypothetical protein